MSGFRMRAQKIPHDSSWDVIVVGGGPAGVAAAVSAAREGARTLLIEVSGSLGGMGTGGLVPAWCPFTDREKFIYGGIAKRVFTECTRDSAHLPKGKIHGWLSQNPERLKRIYDDLIKEAGAEVLFATRLCAVEREDGSDTVETLIVSNKAGLQALSARVYIDATGDGDLAAWAGAEYEKGNEQEEVQPASVCFVLSNVDDYAYEYYGHIQHKDPSSAAYDLLRSDKYPLVVDNHLCQNLIGPSTVGFNAGHIWDIDGTDPVSVSEGMMTGRRIAQQICDGLAEFRPDAFGNAYLAQTAPLMGMRESRRILGDYVLTIEDFLARRSFADEISRNCYFIDIHTAKEEIERNSNGEDIVSGRFEQYGPGESHGIPYRCLTPRGLRNVLVAGRSISCDRPVQGSVRVMPVCMVTGEAAGMAAAHAITTHEADVHAVDVSRLRTRLREEGGWLPDVPEEEV